VVAIGGVDIGATPSELSAAAFVAVATPRPTSAGRLDADAGPEVQEPRTKSRLDQVNIQLQSGATQGLNAMKASLGVGVPQNAPVL
jgi:hypothetical protein